MKITMYELLGMIKNGKPPKKIKYNTFELKRTMSNNLLRIYVDEEGMFFPEYYSGLTLNDEVEIIEENVKIPKKLTTWYSVEVKQSDEENVEYANYNFETMYEKINEICDYLKSKGE